MGFMTCIALRKKRAPDPKSRNSAPRGSDQDLAAGFRTTQGTRRISLEHVLVLIGCATIAVLSTVEALIVWRIGAKQVSQRRLIANERGNARSARLQVQVFLFAIAAGVLYLTARGMAFHEVNESVLVLLGLGGATYTLAKSLARLAAASVLSKQATADAGQAVATAQEARPPKS